jgi:SPW repeat
MQKWVQETSTNEEQVSVNEERVRVPERSGWGSGWVNILLGIWVIISPFVLGIHSPKGIWNNVIVGIVVGILAIIRWSMHQPGWSWLNLLLGIWLVISPFVLFLSGPAMWNNVILGIIIAALALTNTYSKASAPI